MKKFAFCILSLTIFTLTAFAAQNRELPKNFLSSKHPIHPNQAGGRHGSRGNIPTPHGFPAGVDTLVNFTGHFQAPGIFWDGTSHNVWEYSMVGNPPSNNRTTTINAPVVPVTIDMRNSDGSPAFASNGTRLISKPDPFIQTFMNGPVFGSSNWTAASNATQYEHNYFSIDPVFFGWFRDIFVRKWSSAETMAFVPLPPDPPVYVSPLDAAAGQTTTVVLSWKPGPWAHRADVYLSTSSPPALYLRDVSLSPNSTKKLTISGLLAGTTYYWKIVSKTMAGQTATGSVWSFGT